MCIRDSEVTATQAFGSCSSGSQTNTLTLTNAESATAYVKVEYKIDSGSYTTLNNNVSVGASSTDTSQSVSVPHGSTITWKITDSFTSADYTNMTAESEVTSSAADCDPDSTFSTAFGSCGSGAKTSTLTINNTESSDTVYYKVEYKIDSGSYTTLSSNLSVAASGTNTASTVSVPDLSLIHI